MDLSITIPEDADRAALFGSADRYLKMVREAFGVNLNARGTNITLTGSPDQASRAQRVLLDILEAQSRGRPLTRAQLMDLIADASWADPVGLSMQQHEDFADGSDKPFDGRLNVYTRGRRIEPRSDNQRRYLDAVFSHDLVFATGPAGTGKTYLAVAAAVHLLKSARVRRAVLVRPAVEAGEKLGYLPGDLVDKVNPYLRPLLDALNDMLDAETVKRFMSADVVEICPLAFMRGRTLNDAAIILDEAQNTTRTQMQMFLTRMGERSKVIVTGDSTQTDLPDKRDSGLADAIRRLQGVPGVASLALTAADVVRHPIVQRVIHAYESPSNSSGAGSRGESSQSPMRMHGARDSLADAQSDTTGGERTDG